jgi:hypothetical protein
MFALLQIYPPEAFVSFDSADDDDDCGVDVLAVDVSRARLEQFAADYEQRYRASLDEWKAWDDLSCDWGEEHDRKLAELEDRYCVCSPSIPEMHWQIVEIWMPEWPRRQRTTFWRSAVA